MVSGRTFQEGKMADTTPVPPERGNRSKEFPVGWLGDREVAAGRDETDADELLTLLQPETSRAPSPHPEANSHSAEFCLLVPQQFNDTQQIADRFRADAVVICNMQRCETALARRLTDFCSGLACALDGRLRRLDGKILLLVPGDVELSGEAATDRLEDGFFPQV